MKKLLVAVLAMATVSAYAQSHMVRFSNIGSHNGSKDVNLSTDSLEQGDGEASVTKVALNYAYTVAPMFQVGLGLDYTNGTEVKEVYAYDSVSDETVSSKVGHNVQSLYYTVSLYYNFTSDLANAWYTGLHYTFGEEKDVSKKADFALEAGKRFTIGSWNGFNLTYAPNVTIAQTKTEYDEKGVKDLEGTSIAWNFLKFDVLF